MAMLVAQSNTSEETEATLCNEQTAWTSETKKTFRLRTGITERVHTQLVRKVKKLCKRADTEYF